MQISCKCKYNPIAGWARRRALAAAPFFLPSAWAGDGPFFITHTHRLEEPVRLELATKNLAGQPAGGAAHTAAWLRGGIFPIP
jgi:hypothetical protein